METKVLLGITKDKYIIFGDFEITTRNGYKEFTASFDSVIPTENIETDGVEYYEEVLSCYTDGDKYELCERYDCKPSELAQEMAADEGVNTLYDTLDCSLYSNLIDVDGVEYCFESSSCGQHDIFEDEEEFEEFTDEDATKKLYKYWKQYHLKEITDEQEKDINQLLEKLPTDYNEIENIIKTYLQKYVI